jgi:hypothetical protein
MHTLKNEPACVGNPSPHARGAGSVPPSDPAATGAQVPKAPVAPVCCDCRAPMSPLEVTLYRFQCRVCAG